jgi:hypothetical protein
MNMINRVCKYGQNYSLFKVKPITITYSELETIKDIDNLKTQKIAFVLLVLSKINRLSYLLYMEDKIRLIKRYNEKLIKPKDLPEISRNYYSNNKINELFELAKLYMKKGEKKKVIQELINKQLIEMTTSCKFKVNFINNESPIELELKCFDDFILEYERIIGENIGYCENCPKPIRITIHNRKYCHKCSIIHKKELDRIRMENLRKSKAK